MAYYNLGVLAGGDWNQYANAAGQVYYVDTLTGDTQFHIPLSFEDYPGDTFTRDYTKPWPQWMNWRTGRIILRSPYPPPPQTYLDLQTVAAHMLLVERVPDSPEALYRRPMLGILRWLFPDSMGFDVVQEDPAGNGRPDYTILKISGRPGGTDYTYIYCFVESKPAGEPWNSTEDQCHTYCSESGNESSQLYGIVHVGLEIRFFKYIQGVFTPLTERLHLRRDVQDITDAAAFMKRNPLPFL